MNILYSSVQALIHIHCNITWQAGSINLTRAEGWTPLVYSHTHNAGS